MKKITFSHNTKRLAMFAGLTVVCIAALSLVLSRVNAAEPTEPASSVTSSEIVVEPPQSITVPPISSSPSSDTGSAFVPSSGTTASKPLTVESKPSLKPPKPKLPASSALTNKAKKPSYSTPPKAPSSTGTSKPTYTGNNDPIFGDKHGTGGQGSTVGKPGDQLTGHKVGIMD